MKCDTAHELMLTAEVADLEGRRDGPLAEHLRACARCRTAAARLLAAHREMSDVLAAARPPRLPADAAQLAVRTAERHRVAARRLRRALPVAAAALLAGLLLVPQPPQPPGSTSTEPAPVPARFSVTAPPGRSVAVLQQSDTSSVIVVWFF
jgi:ferric-dicitrate binding protein FerR (iron transport regulator)